MEHDSVGEIDKEVFYNLPPINLPADQVQDMDLRRVGFQLL